MAEPASLGDMPTIVTSTYGSTLASYWQSPANTGHLQKVMTEAQRFRIQAQSVPVQIAPDTTIDVGGSVPNESITIAAVPLVENKALLQYLADNLGATPETASASLIDYRRYDPVRSRQAGCIAIGERQSLIIRTTTPARADDGPFASGLHLVDATGLRTLHYRQEPPTPEEAEAVRATLEASFPPRSVLYPSSSGRLLASDAGQWWLIGLVEEGKIGRPPGADVPDGPCQMDRWTTCRLEHRDQWIAAESLERVSLADFAFDDLLAAFLTLSIADATNVYVATTRHEMDNIRRHTASAEDRARADRAAEERRRRETECPPLCLAALITALALVGTAALQCHKTVGLFCPPCHGICDLIAAVGIALAFKRRDACLANCRYS